MVLNLVAKTSPTIREARMLDLHLLCFTWPTVDKQADAWKDMPRKRGKLESKIDQPTSVVMSPLNVHSTTASD